MPAADYELKHLLKRVQLSENQRPKITVITGGTGSGDTVKRFEKFFGKVAGESTYFEKGLNADAIAHLRSIKVLKA